MTGVLPLDVVANIFSFVESMTLKNAIRHDDFKLVQLLVAVDKSKCTAYHMDKAAKRGHLEIVKLLHNVSPAGCTTAAMDGAIRNGHLEVVQFLHCNRSEGCTKAAPCRADRDRGSAVARFLIQHRPTQVRACLVRHAVEWNDLDLVADFLCVKPLVKTARAKEDVVKACKRSRLAIKFLKVLYEKGQDTAPSRALVIAVEKGKLNVIKYLVDQGERCVQEALRTAIGPRRLDIVQLLLEAARVQLKPSDVTPLIDLAADRSYRLSQPSAFVDDFRVIVEMLREKFPDALCSPGKFITAAERGNLGMVKALHCADRAETCCLALLHAAMNCRQSVVEFLAPHCDDSLLQDAAVNALYNGYYSIAKFLVEFCRERNGANTELSYNTTDCSPDMLTVLDRVYQHGPNEKSVKALELAARFDDVGVVAYLAQRNIGDLHTALMAAIGCGHRRIVRYLIKHTSVAGNEDSKFKWMAKAAECGQLQVLIYLHENPVPGLACAPSGMDRAAAAGHLDIVHFLHVHRTEGCTTQAMDGAAYGNHIEVVRFLHANRREGCTYRAFEKSAERGLSAMVKLLLEIAPSRCDLNKGILLAKENGFVEIVAMLEDFKAANC